MVIAYHEIEPKSSPYIYSVTCAQLDTHLQSIREASDRPKPEAKSVLVTFDDGHLSHYEHALPVLERHGIKALFCITAGWTDQHPLYMRKAHLREMAALGHQICAHGWSHKMLTQCTPSELWEELQYAKDFLQNAIGLPIEAISIPHGRWNRRVLEACALAGYREVYVSDPHIGVVQKSGVRLIGRLMITRTLSPGGLQAFIDRDGRSTGLSRGKHKTKKVLRAVLGDARYRRIWRRLGAKSEDLPTALRPRTSTRVLHLISSGGLYGAENMLLNLTRSLQQEDCQCVIGVFRNSQNPHLELADRARQEGFEFVVVPCNGQIDFGATEAIRNAILKHGIDLVHTHGSKANAYGLLAAAPLRTPTVATYHMAWPDRDLKLFSYHLLDRVLFRRFQKVVAVSDAVACSLRRSGLNRQKLLTITNGIDLEPFASISVLNPPIHLHGKVAIGLVGRLVPAKGHCYLLEAARDIIARFPNVQFLFIGDGPLEQALKEQVAGFQLQSHVTFAGRQSDMPAVYRSLDIVVLPSIVEGMPMTLIEAMAAQRPVVASRVGDVPKLVKQDETGLLVEAADPKALRDALLQLLSDPAKAARLAAEGRHWVCQRFTSERMARQYRNVYNEALLKHSSYEAVTADGSATVSP